MLTIKYKNVIIESVDNSKENLRKSKVAGKIKQKIFSKKLLTKYCRKCYNTKAVIKTGKYIEK